MAAGDRHTKPCGYNCPCNLGRNTWTECTNCVERRREESNGWPLCPHTNFAPGCVACAYRRWFNALDVTFTSHSIPYAAFHAGYIAGGGE